MFFSILVYLFMIVAASSVMYFIVVCSTSLDSFTGFMSQFGSPFQILVWM